MESLIYVFIGTPVVITIYIGIAYVTLKKFGNTGE